MISRSSRCTAAPAIERPGLRRSKMDGRRFLIAVRLRRRQVGVATRSGADAVERFAQASVRLGDQERHAEHARPRLPFGHDVRAVVGAKSGSDRAWSRCSSTIETAPAASPSGGTIRSATPR